TAGFAALLGIGIGEGVARSRLRLPAALAGIAVLWLGPLLLQTVATRYALLPEAFGPVGTFWASLLLGLGGSVLAGLATLRLLAHRGPAFEVVELATLGGLLASAVAAHRDGSIARPLWLSDLSWSFGVDPGRVLFAGGAALTALLAGLLLLGSERRKPAVGLLVLPVLAALALLLATRLPGLEPPDPQEALGMGAMGEEEPQDGQASQGQGNPSEGQGGQSEDGEGKGAQSDEPPDPMNPPSGASGPPQPVAVVLLDDDHVPPSGYWYLRQDVLPAFNGTRMVPSEVTGTHIDVLDHFPTQAEQVDVAPSALRHPVRGSVSLLVDHPTPFAPASAVAFAPRGNPDPARFKRSYSFASSALFKPYDALLPLPAGDPTWDPALRAHYLEAPDDPRYQELADRILADLEAQLADRLVPGDPLPPVLKAVAVVKHIGDNMQYTKRERHAGVPDPTADFLFGNMKGYCVHTAHASVYLWRKLGIPARVATGYAVEEDRRRGGTLIVMNGDAHAWPELYLEGAGWVPLDVAPAVDLDQSTARPPDEEELRALGDLARRRVDLPGPVPDRSWIWAWIGWSATGLFAMVVVGVLGLHGLVKAWRRSAPMFAAPPSLARVGYRAALDALTDAGITRTPGETREAFARRLPELPALQALTDLHLRGTLGRPADGDPERDRVVWTGQLARLKHELRSVTPLWRRVLGLLDPTTPYRTR
ncbi:MAG: transglutaminase domain-containing protein, partial [Myxococcales bacterium]|nr:transglutaminase domain-containing protein [Myxococcales bacterium]